MNGLLLLGSGGERESWIFEAAMQMNFIVFDNVDKRQDMFAMPYHFILFNYILN